MLCGLVDVHGLYYKTFDSGSAGLGLRISDLPFTFILTKGIQEPSVIYLQQFRGMGEELTQLLKRSFYKSNLKVIIFAEEARN